MSSSETQQYLSLTTFFGPHLPQDMIVEAEDYLLHPVDKKLKESPKDAVSLSSASTSSMATRQSTASSSDTPFQINVPPRGATTNNRRHQQQPPPPPRDVAGRGAPHTFTPTATVAAGLLHHHRGGDSLPHRGGKEKSSTFESTLDVGSRVWARFSGNKRYYWGNITEKSGEGNFTTYSVGWKMNSLQHFPLLFCQLLYMLISYGRQLLCWLLLCFTGFV